MSAAPPPAAPAGPDAAPTGPDAAPFSPGGTLPPDAPLAQTAGDREAVERERALLRDINARPLPGRLAGYVRLSGPGWLQSALTLGGGSLAGSLYLGVIAGFGLLWLQPLAMALGICMLSAIGYVTLSTGLRPFRAINKHVNPALGWGWLLASGAANIIWALPQYSLACSAAQKNLLPGVLGAESAVPDGVGKAVVCGALLAIALAVTFSYGSGHWGVRVFEATLKILVGLIVLCFVAVVVRLTAAGGLDWGAVFAGFVPDLGALFRPAPALQSLVDGVADPAGREYWAARVTDSQRDELMTAFATAVGINMTFLLPYSMLGRGWGREHRGLGIFDLATGMFIPFFLATTCVVIASATQFHGVPRAGVPLDDAGYAAALAKPAGELTGPEKDFLANVDARVLDALGPAPFEELEDEELAAAQAAAVAERRPGVPAAERALAATLIKRDSDALATALRPVFGGRAVADVVFGLGVLGMALSTICLLMLVSGFVVCEVLNVPATGWRFRAGALLPCLGVLGPFVWNDAGFYLAVPTSVAGFVLLPAAYLTFLLLMNRRELLGDAMPTGGTRIAVNAVLGLATAVSLFGAGWAASARIGYFWLAVVVAGLAAALAVGEVVRRREAAGATGAAAA